MSRAYAVRLLLADEVLQSVFFDRLRECERHPDKLPVYRFCVEV